MTTENVPEVSPEQEKKDMIDYVTKLEDLLPRYARRAAALRPEEVGSVEWSQGFGLFWRQAREDQGFSRYSIAAKAGAHVNDIRLLENGFIEIEQVGDFLRHYSAALTGNATLWETCREQFHFPQSQ